jgi:hypothetical protein
MIANYVRTFPYDPALELKNFHSKQAEYQAAYCSTMDPLALYEALLHYTAFMGANSAARELPPCWLVNALGKIVLGKRTKITIKRSRERERDIQRYRCVRDLRKRYQPGTKEKYTKDQALDLAVVELKGTGLKSKDPTRDRIEESYDKVRKDLKKKGLNSEFYHLVARSDPTVVPVSRTQRADGTIVINGIALAPIPARRGGGEH